MGEKQRAGGGRGRSARLKAYLKARTLVFAGLGLIVAGALTGLGSNLESALTSYFDSSHAARSSAIDLRASANYDWFPEDGFYVAFAQRFTPLQRQIVLSESMDNAISEIDSFGGVRYGVTDEGAHITRIRLVLENRSGGSIPITGMRALIVSRARPLSGTLVTVPPQADTPVVQMGMDLDSRDPIAREVGKMSELGRPYFSRTQPSVEGEAKPFEIVVYAQAAYYRWKLAIDAGVGAEARRVIVTNNGQPFESTGPAARYATRIPATSCINDSISRSSRRAARGTA
jgi:hypothetical protein